MGDVLIKAFSFILMIVAGMVFKRIGLFKDGDDRILSKIVLNFTLPAAVIGAFSNFTPDWSLLVIVLMGIACNLVLSFTGYLVARKGTQQEKVFNFINFSGYNIGSFTMPFIQGFLGGTGVAITCLFDTGNALMCTGGTYAIASGFLGQEKPTLKSFLKKAFSSTPFVSYLFMFLFTMLGFKMPPIVNTIAANIASGNAFLCMFMIGLMFKVEAGGASVKKLALVVALRFLVSTVLALFMYFVPPFPAVVRQVLVLVCFSPISAMAPIFTERCGLDKGLAGAINSVSIPISIVILTGILLVWPPII